MKQSGVFIFTATQELSQAMPKIFKRGETYTVQKVSGVIGAQQQAVQRPAQAPKKGTKKVGRPPKQAKAGQKVGKAPRGRRGASPEAVLQFVRENEGCNMTQIEAAVKMAQPEIRRVLNEARDAGLIRTEGQRRGLRYFAVGVTALAAAPSESSQVPVETPW